MRHAKSGFTLVEIMIVITIIGILGGLAIQQYTRYQRRANVTRTEAELRTLALDVSQFKNHTGTYPSQLQDLLKKPSDPAVAAKWRGKYTEKDEIPSDPWGEEYQYERKPKGAKPPYELYSYGPEGAEADPSDYVHMQK